jgi:hypothetical protein
MATTERESPSNMVVENLREGGFIVFSNQGPGYVSEPLAAFSELNEALDYIAATLSDRPAPWPIRSTQ